MILSLGEKFPVHFFNVKFCITTVPENNKITRHFSIGLAHVNEVTMGDATFRIDRSMNFWPFLLEDYSYKTGHARQTWKI